MSDVNWWLMLLAFLLGAVITWFWSVRRVTREVPRTVVDRDRSFGGSAGAKLAGAGAGVAGVAAGVAALGNRDSDLDVDSDVTRRRGDLEVDRPATEVYDRTTDESAATSRDAPDAEVPSTNAPAVEGAAFESVDLGAPDVDASEVDAATVQRSSLVDLPVADAPDVDAPNLDAPELDAPELDAPEVDAPDLDTATVQRSSLVELPAADAPDADAPNVDAPNVDAPDLKTPDVDASGADAPGGAGGAAAAGAVGLGAASWASSSHDAEGDLSGQPSSEPVAFTGGASEVDASSDADVIESESALETPDAPTGEADWKESDSAEGDATGSESGSDWGSGSRSDSDLGSDATDSTTEADADVATAEDDAPVSEADTGADAPSGDGAGATGAAVATGAVGVAGASVLGARDAGDLAAAKEPVVETGSGSDEGSASDANTALTDDSASDSAGDSKSTSVADSSGLSTPGAAGAAGVTGVAGAGAAAVVGKFGKGSAQPNSDFSGPSGWAIKGNEDSMLFHTQDSPSYKRTKAEVWFEDEDTARKAGFIKWNEKNRSGGAGAPAKLVAIPEGKFGKGSADPAEDGSGPEGWSIKGNEDSNLFHTQDSPYFGRTKAEIWFDTEDAARGAGFVRWDEKNRSGRGTGGAGGAAKLVAIPEGKFGKGSADPAEDGSGPEGWSIKGNEDSNLFHTADSPYYGRTKAEIWFDTEDAARGAGFVRWDEKDRSGRGTGGAAKLVEIPESKFGKGSADPGEDGSGPAGWAIKGNENSMLFHTQDSPAYGRTKAEVWFQDEESARKAGFTKWNERHR